FLLAVGIAYTAGHVLTAPAVSIYIAAILSMLNVKEKPNDLLK
ncbi:O-antigen ligase family protein, partial [Leptospira santarosai]|nr:O-antigen ligase family protein [Leptospira santarosai]